MANIAKNAKNCQIAKKLRFCQKIAILLKIAKNRGFPEGQVGTQLELAGIFVIPVDLLSANSGFT